MMAVGAVDLVDSLSLGGGLLHVFQRPENTGVMFTLQMQDL